MQVKAVKLVYFSPTGTTRKILEGIAKGIGVDPAVHIELTRPEAAQGPAPTFGGELVIIGAPVYAGRLPQDAVARLKRCQADHTPAVLVVVYGNRAYEDALLELTDLSRTLGFIPVSAGAFIGEHSFATDAIPIASGRPDQEDLDRAAAFGAAIAEKIDRLARWSDVPPLTVPGDKPYKAAMPANDATPISLEVICALCGTCATVCPKAAITIDEVVATEAAECIKCCACVKACPEEARRMEHPFIRNIANWLHENHSQRKRPEVFV